MTTLVSAIRLLCDRNSDFKFLSQRRLSKNCPKPTKLWFAIDQGLHVQPVQDSGIWSSTRGNKWLRTSQNSWPSRQSWLDSEVFAAKNIKKRWIITETYCVIEKSFLVQLVLNSDILEPCIRKQTANNMKTFVKICSVCKFLWQRKLSKNYRTATKNIGLSENFGMVVKTALYLSRGTLWE